MTTSSAVLNNLTAVLTALNKKADFEAKVLTTTGHLIGMTLRARVAETASAPVEIVTAYAYIDGIKSRLTFWKGCTVAQLPNRENNGDFTFRLTPAGLHEREDGTTLPAYRVIKMGVGAPLGGGFELLRQLAQKVEAISKATSRLDLEIMTRPVTFKDDKGKPTFTAVYAKVLDSSKPVFTIDSVIRLCVDQDIVKDLGPAMAPGVFMEAVATQLDRTWTERIAGTTYEFTQAKVRRGATQAEPFTRIAPVAATGPDSADNAPEFE